MKGFSSKSKIGQGIYTAADASRILSMPYAKAKYWFAYYAKNRLSKTVDYVYHFPVKNIIAVNFLTLIEMYVFYTLKEEGIKTSTIVKAHTSMAQFTNTPYPFATQSMYRDDKSLFFGTDEELITADPRLQSEIVDVLRPFIKKIQFSDDKVARKFYPLGKEKSVVVNPENQFGQPVIEGTNILTQTIYNLSLGGDSKKFIAKLYDITLKNVEDAIEFARAA